MGVSLDPYKKRSLIGGRALTLDGLIEKLRQEVDSRSVNIEGDYNFVRVCVYKDGILDNREPWYTREDITEAMSARGYMTVTVDESPMAYTFEIQKQISRKRVIKRAANYPKAKEEVADRIMGLVNEMVRAADDVPVNVVITVKPSEYLGGVRDYKIEWE